MTKEKEKPEHTQSPSVKNRKAYFNYEVLEKIEAGICLQGHEVKSIRAGNMNIQDAYVRIIKEEVFLINAHINPYKMANTFYEIVPTRKRKLLLHKAEIRRLIGKTESKGLTLIPLYAYFKRGKLKVEIGLCQGKKKFDKRESIKKKELNREMQKALKSRHR